MYVPMNEVVYAHGPPDLAVFFWRPTLCLSGGGVRRLALSPPGSPMDLLAGTPTDLAGPAAPLSPCGMSMDTLWGTADEEEGRGRFFEPGSSVEGCCWYLSQRRQRA